MELGPTCPDVLNTNPANPSKFPGSVPVSQATVLTIIPAVCVNLIAYLDRISDPFVPLMGLGNLIQFVKAISGNYGYFRRY